MPATVIALENHKGGVAKSTLTANLLASLAARGSRCLGIDCDAQGSLSISFGYDGAEAAPGIADVLLRDLPLASVVRRSPVAGVDLVTASLDLLLADLQLAFLEHRVERLRRALAPVLPAYDFVLLDLPPSLGLVSLNGMIAADHYVIPVAPNFLDLKGVAGMAEIVRYLGQLPLMGGRIPNLLGFVLTRVDFGRGAAVKDVIAMLRSAFGAQVFDTVVGVDTQIAQAPSFGRPCVVHFPNSRGAVAHNDVAAEMLARLGRLQ